METITNLFLGRWWSHLASIACLGFGVFCFLSIQRKNPLFKTKDRSKELMPYKHQVLWTLCFGGVFLVLGSYLLLESVGRLTLVTRARYSTDMFMGSKGMGLRIITF